MGGYNPCQNMEHGSWAFSRMRCSDILGRAILTMPHPCDAPHCKSFFMSNSQV